MEPIHYILIDIDGLRWDVFHKGLAANQLPNLSRLLGVEPLLLPTLSTAASITFCAQASLFTGEHPAAHGIPGNQFFDRFGTTTNGQPAFYAFDLGDTLEVDDAVRVFTHGLAADRLQQETIYEKLGRHGFRSVVATNMYATGSEWLKPSLVHLGRFLKGGNLLGMSAEQFDQATFANVRRHVQKHGLPEILSVYFMGLDFESHKHGTQQQGRTLQQLDGLIGELLDLVEAHAQHPILTAVFSDHGQIDTPDDPRYALRLGFPFDRALDGFFTALNLDVHDYPGEAPDCDAVMALNGGTAAVYIHHHTGHWWDTPRFFEDVLPVAQAFWDTHHTGRFQPQLQGSLAGVLLRDVEHDGWHAPYRALRPDGRLVELGEWFDSQDAGSHLDAAGRLASYAGRFCGDLILLSHSEAGFYFGKPLKGMHGGLHPHESQAVLAFGSPAGQPPGWPARRAAIQEAIATRQLREQRPDASLVDLVTGIEAALNSG